MCHQSQPSSRIAVLGGGITGLTAFYLLGRARREGAPITECLIEASGRLGGLIKTERLEDFVIEAGPDSFLSEKPEGIALARELGLEEALAASNDAARRTYIARQNRLIPLPDGMLLFVPTRLGPVLRSGLLPLSTRLAVLRETIWSRSSPGKADEPAAGFVRRHFGNGMLENVAAPLLEGIYGGDAEKLSARSVLPRLVELERRYGSLIRGARRVGGQAGRAQPVFTTLREGMEQLVRALLKAAGDGGPGRVRLGVRAVALEASKPCSGIASSAGGSYRIRCENGESVEADSLILALPAFECANLLRGFSPSAATDLEAIPYTPAVMVVLGYSRHPGRLPPGCGFLVPRGAGLRLVACTFVHQKFPFRVPEGGALLRCFYGGTRDCETAPLSDDDLAARAAADLRKVLGITAPPGFVRIYRWPRAMPQYIVGHEDRMARVRLELEKHPGLYLAGNAYSGIGISECIRTAKAAVEQVMRFATRG